MFVLVLGKSIEAIAQIPMHFSIQTIITRDGTMLSMWPRCFTVAYIELITCSTSNAWIFPPKQPRKFGIDKFTTPTAIGYKSHDFPIQCPIQCDICVLISKTAVIIIIIIIVIHLCKSGENNHQIKSTSTFMHRM